MTSARTRINLVVTAAAVLVLALATSACSGGTKVAATPDVSKEAPATSLEVDAADYSFKLNSQVVAAGRVPVSLHNGGNEAHQVMILRLHDGVSVDQYLSAAQSDEGAAGSLIDNAGGVNIVDPGASGTGYADLQPGSYALVCYIPSGDHVGHLHKGMVAELTVPETAAASPIAEPAVLGDIVMQDFNFTLPPQGLSAPGTYRFVNNGAQAHEFVVMRINDGKTLGDVLPYLQAGFQGDKPLTFASGSGGVEPGNAGYVDLALSPGEYVAMCFITDPASHKHHAELGMFLPFTIPA
jgi:uncharacterized cupredoxin-like copper-binding protein